LKAARINATGRFAVNTSTTVINYTQTGGVITVCTVGNTSSTLASFDLGTSTSGNASSVTISGGTIVVQLPNTAATTPARLPRTSRPEHHRHFDGHGRHPAAWERGPPVPPRRSILRRGSQSDHQQCVRGHTAVFLAPAVFNNITRNITISPTTTLNLGNQVLLFNGTTLTNNGTLVGDSGQLQPELLQYRTGP
jgi:hypothetical protein